MHIPDHMIEGTVCHSTAAITAIGLAAAIFMAARSDKKPEAIRFAAVTALLFAGQMMNFPVLSGTSGHLMGGVLASALLGTPFGVLSIALLVTVQALFFADGGVTVLGANIFNMALVGAGLGGMIQSYMSKLFGNIKIWNSLLLGLAAWISLVAASLACSVELAMSEKTVFTHIAADMFGVHAMIGLAEAAITMGLFYALNPCNKTIFRRLAFASALLIVLFFSPFASNLPDGLEWVAARHGLLIDSLPVFAGPLAGYKLAAFGGGHMSTAFAGLMGVSIAFFAALIAGRTPIIERNKRPYR